MDFYLYLKKYLKKIIGNAICAYLNKVVDFNIGNILLEDVDKLKFKCYVKIFIDDIKSKHKEYIVICIGNLEDLDNTFQIIGIKKYKQVELQYKLDKNFIPILNKKQFDMVANKFLKEYYPNALSEEFINIKQLLNNIGLRVKHKKLSLDKTVFGLICFKDIEISYYENDIEKKELAKKGTIYIDIEATNEYAGEQTANFAIIHECVHWYLHRKFFAFREFISNKIKNRDLEINVLERVNLNWMEYQASEIASRILLPENPTRKYYCEIMRKLNNQGNQTKRKLQEQCISTLAKKADISKEAVKVRLLKMGLKVNGVFEYIDGKYINPYIYERKLDSSESFSISFRNLLTLAMNNEEFRELLSTNNYIFVDNHLCFKNSKFLFVENNQFHLTEYALDHIDECCILFLYDIDKKYEYINNFEYILCKTQSRKQKHKIKSFESINDIKVHPEKFGEYYNKVSIICDDLPYNFRKKLRYLRETVGMTREQLEEKSYISSQTIKEIENNNKRGYSVETIIALCIGMKLPPEFSFDLLRIAGFNIENNGNEINCLYCFILRNLYDCGIDYVNEILKINKFPALGQEKQIA